MHLIEKCKSEKKPVRELTEREVWAIKNDAPSKQAILKKIKETPAWVVCDCSRHDPVVMTVRRNEHKKYHLVTLPNQNNHEHKCAFAHIKHAQNSLQEELQELCLEPEINTVAMDNKTKEEYMMHVLLAIMRLSTLMCVVEQSSDTAEMQLARMKAVAKYYHFPSGRRLSQHMMTRVEDIMPHIIEQKKMGHIEEHGAQSIHLCIVNEIVGSTLIYTTSKGKNERLEIPGDIRIVSRDCGVQGPYLALISVSSQLPSIRWMEIDMVICVPIVSTKCIVAVTNSEERQITSMVINFVKWMCGNVANKVELIKPISKHGKPPEMYIRSESNVVAVYYRESDIPHPECKQRKHVYIYPSVAMDRSGEIKIHVEHAMKKVSAILGNRGGT